MRIRRLTAGALCLAAAASAAGADVYPVDFFPELPQEAGLQQLLFVPGFVRPDIVNGTITQTTLHITFTTGNVFGSTPFDAAGLTLLFTAAVPDSPGFGFWLVTGADLGWSGQGTFTADLSTDRLNGLVVPGRWSFDLSGPPDLEGAPTPYAGEFSADSRIDITYTPACLADFNQSGGVSVQDIFDFLGAYFADDASADINESGEVSVQDIFDFLGLYFSGCTF